MTEQELTIEQVAGDNVGDWMRQAIQNIDAEFGAGFARNNPDLIAAMIQASAIDSGVAYIHNMLAKPIEDMVNLAYYYIPNDEETPDAE